MAEKSRGRPLKVPLKIEKYGLEGYGEELEELWTRDSDSLSLRSLEIRLNAKFIQAVVEQCGEQLGLMEAESYYQALSGEEAEDYHRENIKERLRDTGVDVDDLIADFASYHSVWSYLRFRGASKGDDEEEDPEAVFESAMDSIEEYLDMRKSYVDDEVENLADVGVIAGETPEINHSIKVVCSYCGDVHPLIQYLRDQGCGCEDEPEPVQNGLISENEEDLSDLLEV